MGLSQTSRCKVATAESVRLVLPTAGCVYIMSAPKTQGMMDADNRSWSWAAEVALLKQVRQHRHLLDTQDKLYGQSLRKTTFESGSNIAGNVYLFARHR